MRRGIWGSYAEADFSTTFVEPAPRPKMSRTEDRQHEIRRLEVATAAHDLRNRLSILRCQILQLSSLVRASPYDASVRNSLISAACSLALTNDSLENLLELAADQVRLPITVRRASDIVSLVRQFVAENQYARREHHIVLATTLPHLVGAWHPRRMRLVLQILLDNAVTYCPKGGCVTVEVEADDEWATIVVRDNGPAIPAEDLPHLFEPFFRGRNAASDVAGLGLGLPTARLIVEQYAGTLEVESDEVNGNSFTVRLPLDAD